MNAPIIRRPGQLTPTMYSQGKKRTQLPQVQQNSPCFDRVDVKTAKAVQPFWIFHRLRFTPTGNVKQIFIEKINPGFVYLLRNLFIKCNGFYRFISEGTIELTQNPFYCEIFSCGNLKKRQCQPITVQLIATPGPYGLGNLGKGVVYLSAPSAVDANIFSVNATSQGPTCVKKLNYFFVSGDGIRIEFTTTLNSYWTVYLDCVLDGYYIPEKELAYWEGAQL
jgi:hypothetical protein